MIDFEDFAASPLDNFNLCGARDAANKWLAAQGQSIRVVNVETITNPYGASGGLRVWFMPLPLDPRKES